MKTYILKRLLLMIPTLIGITLITYSIVRLAPGDAIEAMIRNQAGGAINPKAMLANVQKIRERLGLIEYHPLRDAVYGPEEEGEKKGEKEGAVPPSGAGYVVVTAADKGISTLLGYGRWVGNVCTGHFGQSILNANRDPLELIIERLPITVPLNVISEFLIFIIAIPIGLAAARRQGRWFDRGSSFVMIILWSVPAILAGTLLIGFLGVGGLGLHWFPIEGLHAPGYEKFYWGRYLADLFWHAALPVVCLTYGGLAYLAKMCRASLLENLRADYVRTARAKGLAEGRVIYHHALRNSLLPMITTMVLVLPGLIGGSVIVETIFSIHGTGLLLVDAAIGQDLDLVMAETLLYGVLTLVFLLIGDVLYAWADPRVRYE